ncbi:MAG TPA: hypothetical protein VFW71_05945 [Actinomycetota bacterium]|nr:hypothetical protein [Actinomycetota bacterium]
MKYGPEDAAESLCPHCHGRPAAAHHPCPLDLEIEGCTCCGACAKTCSDIQRHIETHTTHVFMDRGRGEIEIVYIDSPLPEDEDPLGPLEWEDPGDFGLSA